MNKTSKKTMPKSINSKKNNKSNLIENQNQYD